MMKTPRKRLNLLLNDISIMLTSAINSPGVIGPMGEHEQVSTHSDAAALESAQREIQRKLGRNLLRLQQVEQMLKAFWIDHEVFGESAELLTIQQARKTEVAEKTLGAMAKKLVGSFLTSGDTESQAGDSPEINVNRPGN